MKWFFGLLVVAIWPLGTFDQIGRNNIARTQGEAAFLRKDFEEAARQFEYLSQQPAQNDASIWLNLGHAYYALGRFQEARIAYGKYIPEASGGTVAIAYTQLGVMASAARDTSGALNLFRRALLTDPENEPARYNFELLKKQFSGRTKAQKKPKVQSKKTSSQQEQEVVRSARQEQILRRLRNLNMTEEQANQVLNAMQDDDLPLELARRRSARKPQSSTAKRW